MVFVAQRAAGCTRVSSPACRSLPAGFFLFPFLFLFLFLLMFCFCSHAIVPPGPCFVSVLMLSYPPGPRRTIRLQKGGCTRTKRFSVYRRRYENEVRPFLKKTGM